MVLETENAQVDDYLDARGLTCPMPLLKTKLALNAMQSGQVLKVSATDAGSQRDFQRFAELSGHVLLRSEHASGEYHYWLRKS
ncbi:sulfurtransferase TusA family protein [Halopseudomonas nanhaiensis]|uniref:sulfurtransferase TusA family protein n=1 Tax=Halopseudomonas nanhaiensis TaxID=2830842 RepID=UPI001CBF957F|nr:sulfurtransferase TusA family protein [Halopseudomonas nanhaiensis]UAW97502.1 sulfurtransferase TusA family protein [Halopseudomonas nanhaiensis]